MAPSCASSSVRFLAPLWIVVLAARADAQFDNAWATFAPDATRLKSATGTPATYLATNTLEKDLAWVDLDGDGWPEVIQADVDFTAVDCAGDRCRIFHNPGGPVGSPIVLREEAGSTTGAWRGVVGMTDGDLRGTWDSAAFDLDNDGDVDLVFARCSGVFVWMNQQHQGIAPKAFCAGDGSGSNCACSNKGGPGRGCANSNSVIGARLTAAGVARISSDTLRLTGVGTYHCPGLFIQGPNSVNGGLGTGFGDGLWCAGGTVIRLGVDVGADSESTYPSGPGGPNPVPISVRGGAAVGDTLHYQFIYRDANPAYCTPSTFNSTNGVIVTWIP